MAGTHHHIPDDFKCPISLEVMSDPVILSSGHTFDRPSIQRWLDSGHRTCPITNLPLPDFPSLIPNHALRSLISNYSSTPLPKQKTHQNPQTLIANFTSRSSAGGGVSKLEALTQLVKLTKFDPALRRLVTESGAVSSILACVSSSADSPSLQEKALSLLLNLSLDDDSKVGLVAEGAIGKVVAVLNSGSSDCRAIGCTILTSLAVVEVNKATIGDFPNAIHSLVNLLESGKGRREVKEAATALYAICSYPDNRRRAVEHGAVPVLVRLVGSGMERAAEVLSALVKCKEGRNEMGKVYGIVQVLVKVISSGRSGKGIQCALFTLNSLCFYNEEVREEAKRLGVIEVCVALGEDENEKIRKTAESLVRTLGGSCS